MQCSLASCGKRMEGTYDDTHDTCQAHPGHVSECMHIYMRIVPESAIPSPRGCIISALVLISSKHFLIRFYEPVPVFQPACSRCYTVLLANTEYSAYFLITFIPQNSLGSIKNTTSLGCSTRSIKWACCRYYCFPYLFSSNIVSIIQSMPLVMMQHT